MRGIITGDLGVDREGNPKEGMYTPGMELRAKYTLFAEGCRGHIGKQLINRFQLNANVDPQHYAIGIKELWDIDPAKHEQGLVVHTAGWPLNDENTGGSFLYHLENNQVVVGLIVDLSYSNPYLSPFDEFQRYKHHPVIKQYLEGGKRVSYGARAIAKGGINCLPKMVFNGGALIGCDAGTLNFAKIKGSHTAMKSGMLVTLRTHCWPDAKVATATAYEEGFRPAGCTTSYTEPQLQLPLQVGRNQVARSTIDQNIFGGRSLHPARHQAGLRLLKTAAESKNRLPCRTASQLDKLSSVFLSNTNREEEQPVHLKLTDPSIPIGRTCRCTRAGPALLPGRRLRSRQQRRWQQALQISAQRCVHCKTCDIGPAQNHLVARRYRRTELPQHVRPAKRLPGPF